MPAVTETIDTVQSVTEGTYKWGFETDIDMEFAPKGLNEDIVRFISRKKNEPDWLLEWRLKAFALWKKMEEPRWAAVSFPPIDYQDAYYYAAPKQKAKPKSLDEVDPELLRTYEKLGIPLKEQAILAGVEARARARPTAAACPWRWTRCSTASPSPPPSRRGWRRRASSSAPSRRRCRTIPSWCGSTSAPWCRRATISTRR